MTAEFAGKTAVITGSTSGIGKAVACELASAGAAVVLHGAHRRRALENLARRLASQGVAVLPLMADFSLPADRRLFLDSVCKWRPSIDILVLCAGADILSPPLVHASFDDKLHALWQVDVLGTIELSREIGLRMKHRGRGLIITIGWDAAFRGMETDSAQLFAAAKGAVMAFTLSLAHALAPHVRVLCIAPGWIRTAWARSASAVWENRARLQSLRRRWGQPHDIARIVRFLASPAADFLNAQIIPVNGGFDAASFFSASSAFPRPG